jgi:hypothetical protein
MADSRGTRGVVGPFWGGHVEAALVIFGSGKVFTKSTSFGTKSKLHTPTTIL